MKIRNGFVSNSSSTSYVILIPTNFDVDTFVFNNLDKLREIYFDDMPRSKRGAKREVLPFDYIDSFISRFKKHIKNGGVGEDGYDGNSANDMYAIQEMMADNGLVIAEFEGGPDASYVSFVRERDIRNKLDAFQQHQPAANEVDALRKKINDERDKQVKKKADKRKKTKDIDPYDEEQWED